MSAQDYKETLNLPNTAFPMKANLPQREPERLAKWQQSQLYQQIRTARQGKPKYVLHDGPPYANGEIHLGHAVNKILKDIIVKAKTLSDYDAAYIPGWDCHGLPIELNVEKKVGKPGVKVDFASFRQACRTYAEKQVNQQRDAFIRLGGLGDWFDPYLTMNYRYEADEIRAIGKILANGHLQQGFKPVHWCIDCRSALALAEVEYQNKTSLSIYVKFPVVLEQQHLPDVLAPLIGLMELSVLIWTTTPWTLPANQAVALHADYPYIAVEVTIDDQPKQCLIVAEGLLIKLLDELAVTEHKVLASFAGRELEHMLLQHPFYERQVPIVLGEHVTLDSGTGAVHTAPGHGQEDYQVAKHYNLPVESPVGNNGCYLPGTPLFAGLPISKANGQIIDLLLEQNKLVKQTRIEHSYPHCWRHKTPLIFRATPQWFISMNKNGLRDKAIAAAKQIQWRPEWGKQRIISMLENNPDWCISRQRVWGVPLPFFLHKDTQQLHPNTLEFIEPIAQLIEQNGIQAWHDLAKEQFLGDDAKYYEKSQDTVDVWLDSGLSHQCVLQARDALHYPAEVYFEGSDQHRGWFQSSLLSALAIHDEAPYRTVVTHGFTVDEQGRKMSKSLGNVIAPDKVIKQWGADILRLWAASADYQGEITLSEQILKRSADTYRRIRNTAKYFLSNLHDFDPQQDMLAYDQLLPLDQWAIARAHEVQQTIQECYDQFDFHLAVQTIHHFCAIDMGGFYLDIIKDRQYTMPKNSLGRRSAQTALYHLLQAFVRWIAPILSFTADEIWEYMPKAVAKQLDTENSVFLATWYDQLQPLAQTNADEQLSMTQLSMTQLSMSQWQLILALKTACNKEMEALRNAHELGATLEASVTIYATEAVVSLLTTLGEELRFILITSQAHVKPLAQAPAELTELTQLAGLTGDLAGVKLQVEKVTDPKCERCWHRCSDIGSNLRYPTLCSRCIKNISADPRSMTSGETRKFA